REAAARVWAEFLERRLLLAATLPNFGGIAPGRVVEPRGAHAAVPADHASSTAVVPLPDDAAQLIYLLPQHSLVSQGGFLTDAARGKPLDVALKYLADHAADFGVTPADLANPAVMAQYSD